MAHCKRQPGDFSVSPFLNWNAAVPSRFIERDYMFILAFIYYSGKVRNKRHLVILP